MEQKWRTRTLSLPALRCPQRISVARGSNPAARISAAHSEPCGRAARPNRSQTTTCAASWEMISASAREPLDAAATLISRTSLGGIHRASADLRFVLTAIPRRETRGSCQVSASLARCARPICTTRSCFADIASQAALFTWFFCALSSSVTRFARTSRTFGTSIDCSRPSCSSGCRSERRYALRYVPAIPKCPLSWSGSTASFSSEPSRRLSHECLR